MKKLNIITWIIAMIILLTSQISNAANVSWNAAVSGNWNDGTKWSGGVAPTVNDTAVITIAGTYTVTLNVNASIAKLVIGGASGLQTLVASNRTFTINNASVINALGVLNTADGNIINGTGSLQNNGLMILNYNNAYSIPVNNNATINVNHYGNYFNGAFTTTATSLISVTGLSYTTDLTFGNSFTNNGTMEMKSISGYTSNFYITAGTITNSVSGIITTNGPYNVAHTIFAPVNNQGAITGNYNLTIQHAGVSSNSGTISVPAGIQLQYNTGSLTVSGGTLTGAGKLYFNNCVVNYNLATFQPLDLIFDNSTVNSTSSPVTNNNTNIQFNYNNNINASISNNDSVRVTHYGNIMSGAMFNNATGYFIVEGLNYTSDFVVNNSFTNTGNVELKSVSGYTSSLGIGTGYTLTNQPTGLIKAFGPYNVAFSINGTVNNQGTITCIHSLNINATAGTSLNTGTINVSATKTLKYNGAAFTYTGGTTNGPGNIYFNNCTANFNVSTFPGIDLLFDNSALTSTSLPITNNNNIQFNYNNIISAAIFNNTGIIRVSHYGNTMSGALTTATTSLISIEGSNYTSEFTMSSGFTNNGTIDMRSISGYISNLYISTGVMINSPSGIIHSYAGAYATARNIYGAVNNQGTITVDLSLNIQSTGASSNTGNFFVAAAQTLTYTNGSYTFTTGNPSGTGKLYFNNVIAAFNNTNYPNMYTTFDNSTINSTATPLVNDTTWQLNYNNIINANVLNQKKIRVTHYGNTWTGALTTIPASLLTIDGFSYTSDITFNTSWTNNGTIDMRSISGYVSNIYMSAAAALTNAVGATLHSYAGTYSTTRTFSGALINNGNLIVDITLTHTNTSVTSSNTGNITIASGQQYSVSNGTYNFNAGTATGDGKLYFNSTIVNYNVSVFPTVFQFFDNSTINSSFSPITNNHTLQLNYQNTVAANVFNHDTIRVSYYSNMVNGTMTSASTSVLSVEGSNLTSDITFNTNFTNNGLTELKSVSGYNSALYMTATKTFTNAAGATFRSWAGTYSSGRNISGAFVNNGNFIVDLTLAHANASASSINTGSITIASGQQYNVSNGTYNFNSGTATGAGKWYFSSTTCNYNVSAFPAVWQMFDGSTINSSSSPIQNNNVLQWNYQNSVNASINNNDSILVTYYATVVHGTYTAPLGSMLSINGQNYTSDITFDNAFTNHGTLELVSVSGYNSSIYFSNGTFINETDGTVYEGGTYNVSHLLQAPAFENRGQMRSDYQINVQMTAAPKRYYNKSTGTFKAKGTITHNANTAFVNEGHFQPGLSPGQISFSSAVADSIHLMSSSHIDIEIGGYTVGTQYDKIIYNGKTNLNGTLNLSLINGFIPALGDSFIVITYANKTGTFAAVTGQTIPGGLYWNVFYRSTYVVIRAGNPPNLDITSSTGTNGTISPLGITSVVYNGTQTYNMIPNTNYHVLDVLVDGGSVGAVTSYTFSSVIVNHTISVTFAINTWNIVATTNGNGTISPSGTVIVNAGNNQLFNIAANPCNLIDSVIVDGIYQGTNSSYTFTNVVANHTIKAVFRIAPRITASGATTFCAGGSVTLDAGAGYTNYQWSNSASTQTTNITTSGTYTCTITSTGGCTSATSVVVTVNPLPTVTLSQFYPAYNNHVCATSGNINLSLSSFGLPMNGSYSGIGVYFNTVYQEYSPSSAGVGSHVITYTYTDANGCTNSGTNTVIVDQSATTNAGIDIILCNNPLANLSGAIGGSATSSTWSSNGTGGFGNANNLSTTYTLSAADMTLGVVTLTLLTNDPANTCGAVSDQLVITYNPDAVADAGPGIACVSSSSVAVSGSISGYPATPQWTTTGTGTFVNANSLSTTYNPSVADLAASHVYLILTPIDPLGNCTFTADTLDAWFNPNYTVNAGSDVLLCGINDTIATINGSSVNATSVAWTSSGSGIFANANNANTTYILSASDRANGYLQLTLTTNDPTGPCTAVSDFMIVKYKYAIADAGVDVCGDTTTVVSGSAIANALASSTLNVLWTTTGTGSFTNANSSGTNYIASNADLTSGQTKIYFNLIDGAGECTYGKDSMVIWYNPHYSVSTATDTATFCANAILNISGSSVNTLSTTWTTSGTGTFGNANNLATTYTPSNADTTAGFVTLTVSSNDPNGPCGAVSDNMYVIIHSAPDASAGNNTPICNGTDLNLTASGGTSYSWTGPNGFTSSQQNIVIPNSTVTMSGTYTVIVSNNFGCSNPASTVVIVNPCGCIAPSLLQSHIDVTCFAGSDGSIDLTAVGGSGGNTFLWSNNATTEDISGLTAGTYTVTVTAAGGCTAGLTVTISQPAIPLPPITITANGPTTICNGSNVVLDAGAGFALYAWSNGATTQTNTITIAGSYTVTATNGAGCTASSVAPVAVTVIYTPPAANVVVPPIIGLPLYACNGQTNSISVPPVPGATQYIWDGPAGSTFNGGSNPFTNSTPTANITFSSVVSGASGYHIGVQAANECGVTLRKVQWVRGITSVPAAVIGNSTVCPGSSETYSMSSIIGATYYTWTAPSGVLINGSSSPYTTTNLNVSVSYPLNFSSGNICVASNTPCYNSPFKCLFVTKSAAQPGAMSGVFTVCPNSSQTYSVPSAGPGTYSWTLPANCSGSSTSNFITVSFANNFSGGTICVTYTNQCGETSVSRCKSVSTGLPGTPSSISGPSNGVCGVSAIYTGTSVSGATSYQWTLPSGSTGSSTTNSISAVLPGTGFTSGSVCIQSMNICGISAQRCITVKGPPNSPASITTNPSSWCANTSGIEFNAGIGNVQGTYSLNWNWPLAAASYVSGQGTSTLMLDWGTGNGTVAITASNACGAATKTYSALVNCREMQPESETPNETKTLTSKTFVYPNPSSGKFNIEFTNNNSQNRIIQIVDLSGRIVFEKTVLLQNDMNVVEMDLSNLAKGAYRIMNVNEVNSVPIPIIIN